MAVARNLQSVLSDSIIAPYLDTVFRDAQGRMSGDGEMIEQIENINGKAMFDDAVEAVESAAARTRHGVDEFRNDAEHFVEAAVDKAKRLAKKGRYAAEDMIDDTEHLIKKEPFRAVGVTFGVGIGVGLLAGLLIGQMRLNCRDQTEH